MRLLHTGTLELHTFPPDVADNGRPPYAVLSHCWREGQLSYSEFANDRERALTLDSFSFVKKACQAAKESNIDYLWIYTICVDQSSTAEVSEAANSAFAWMSRCEHLFVYLDDLPPITNYAKQHSDGEEEEDGDDDAVWSRCLWFSRCWTLQELLAPFSVRFYDQDWNFRGCKTSEPLKGILSRITHIVADVLCDSSLISEVSLAKRMSWAAKRRAFREEDRAYSLMGIFNVFLPVIYGEGSNAFLRLQEAILKDTHDLSLLIWDAQPSDARPWRGLLANSPAEFHRFISCPPTWCNPLVFKGEITFTNKGMRIRGNYLQNPQSRGRGVLLDLGGHDGTPHRHAVLAMFRLEDCYVRPAVGAAGSLPTEAMLNAPIGSVTAKRDIDLKSSMAASNILRYPALRPVSKGSPLVPVDRPTSITPLQQTPVQEANVTVPFSGNNGDPAPAHCGDEGDEGDVNDDDDTVSKAPSTLVSGSCVFSPRASSLGSGSILDISYYRRKRQHDPCDAPAPGVKRVKTPLAAPRENTAKIVTTPGWPARDVATANLPAGNTGAACGLMEDRTRDSDGYHTLPDDLTEKPPILEPNHEFRGSIPEIVQLALCKFAAWKVDPRTRPLAPRFACPLSLVKPNRCRRCFTRCELLTLRDLQKHLTAHRLPLYCPVCYMEFSGASDRDEHIVQRNCELRDQPPTYEGISEEKLRLISNVPASLPAVKAWYAIWDILYPETSLPSSPWLPGEVGLQISLARDFWAETGQLIVSGFLESKNKLSWDMPDEERSLAALYSLVLDHLIDEIFNGQDKPFSYVSGKQVSANPGPATRSQFNVGSFVWPLISKWIPQNRQPAPAPPGAGIYDRTPPQDQREGGPTLTPSAMLSGVADNGPNQ